MTLHGCIAGPQWSWVTRKTEFCRYTIYELLAGEALPHEAEDWLIAGLTRAMPRLRIAAYFEVRRSTLPASDHLTVAVARTRPELIGFLSSRWFNAEAGGGSFLHASILLISDQYQRTLLFKHLWRLHLEQMVKGPHGLPSIVALKTYNPAVYNVLSGFTRLNGVRLYPRIDIVGQDAFMKRLAASIHERIAAGLEFDCETGVIRGAGNPPDFYPELPDHRRRDICDYFQRNLRAGDRLLCILTLPESPDLRRGVLRMFGANEAPEVNVEWRGGLLST